MDELEISGRRYISSRLAAKQNKYHSDYIGQLIRSGKVVGEKVGRSWYVDAASLAEYLGKEIPVYTPKAAVTPLSSTPEEAAVETQEKEEEQETDSPEEDTETFVEIETKEIAPIAVAKPRNFFVKENFQTLTVPQKIVAQEMEEERPVFMHIEKPWTPVPMSAPKEKKGLVYFAEDTFAPAAQPAVYAATDEKESGTDSYSLARERKVFASKRAITKGAVLFLVGAVALVLFAVVSNAISTTTVVEEGRPASVGYSLP